MSVSKSGKVTIYKKIFSRDRTLPWLQIWYKDEVETPKPWNHQKNKSFPYIVFVRKDNTVQSYYDPAGLNWSRNSIVEELKKDVGFIDAVKKNVEEGSNSLKHMLKRKALGKKEDLLLFFNLFQKAYAWFETMWEICESPKNIIGSLDINSIRTLRETTNFLSTDIDDLIRNSLIKIYPFVTEYNHVLTIQEIRLGIFPSLEVLRKRDEGFIYTDNALFELEDLYQVEAAYNIKLEQEGYKKTISFNGNIASLGYAKGMVRKVMGYKDMSTFKEGEILVSPMTEPNFILLMKKAAAIVTDEGGITCHAAIISRELKKPCIVGTQIATSVLKNGDFIEVDANQGVIKILKENR